MLQEGFDVGLGALLIPLQALSNDLSQCCHPRSRIFPVEVNRHTVRATRLPIRYVGPCESGRTTPLEYLPFSGGVPHPERWLRQGIGPVCSKNCI